MFQSTSTELSQKPQLSHRMQQSLKVLGMNIIQLEQFLQAQFEENVFLEEEKAEDDDETARYLEYLHQYMAGSAGSYPESGSNHDEYEHDIPSEDDKTLKSYIYNQLDITNMTDRQLTVVRWLVEWLDDNGYLDGQVQQYALDAGILISEVENGINMLQQLDPPGIGARNLEECLKIQLRRMGIKEKYLYDIVDHHLEHLGKGHLNAISESLGLPVSNVRKALDVIRKLNPKPSCGFYSKSPGYILPDIIILQNKNGTFEPYINEASLPSFHVSTYYRSVCKTNKEADVSSYLEKKLAEAKWLVNCVVQRKTTLLKIIKAMIEFQQQFILHGIGYLVPMKLSDISEKTGLHISTVSRAINEKHMLCPRGLFSVKQLFTHTIGSNAEKSGDSTNLQNIRQVLMQLIQTEDRQNPYSDNKLSDLLAEKGFVIMRRTVAKYRDELGIPCKALRKSLCA